ncbi:MAG: hypothetical protein CVT67_02930 [Actinobacteria bacterium HGW-Actinobacteria-7]|nr:MAG: hypothetical protein CVT67_02930 [Actinobacteria bacterium HGW-Actinobacteria-7]
MSKHNITRAAADELCEWIAGVSVVLKTQEQERIYYRAVAGDITEAIQEFRKMLRVLLDIAEKRGTCKHTDDMQTRWRRWASKKALLDCHKALQYRVMSYLPMLVEADDDQQAITENKALLRDVIQTYGWHRQ